MKLQTIVAELSKPENHWKRSLLKWMQNIAAGGTIGGFAASSPWSIGISVVAFAISKVLEGKASATANDERLNQSPSEPVHAEELERPTKPKKAKKPTKETLPLYKHFFEKGQGTLTAIQKANRAAAGLPSASELKKTERKLKQARYDYGVKVTIPGQEAKEFSCKNLTEANKLFKIEVEMLKIEVAAGRYPAGSQIEVTKTPKP